MTFLRRRGAIPCSFPPGSLQKPSTSTPPGVPQPGISYPHYHLASFRTECSPFSSLFYVSNSLFVTEICAVMGQLLTQQISIFLILIWNWFLIVKSYQCIFLACALLFLLAPGTWMSINSHFLVACEVRGILNAEDFTLLRKQRFLRQHDRVSQTARIPYSLLMRLLCLLSSQKCQSNAPKTSRHLHSCLLASPSHRSMWNVWWKARFMRTSMVNGRVLGVTFGPWTFPLKTDTSAWFILSFFHFPPGHETSFGFASKWVFGLWFYWGPEIQSIPWLLSSVTKYSENINLSQLPRKQILPRILAVEKQWLD